MENNVQVSASVMEEIRAGRMIAAIKQLRTESGLDLKEAKAIIVRETAALKASEPNYVPETRSSKLSNLKSSSALSQALAEISDWIDNSSSLHAKNLRCQHQLRAGLTEEKIDLCLQDVEFTLPEELRELYQWHNGDVLLGDYSNPISFVPLQQAVSWMINKKLPQLPIFIGDAIYYVVSSETDNQKGSQIHCYESSGSRKFEINMPAYAPSMTSLMQAVSECVRKHDGMSSYFMAMDKNFKIDSSLRESERQNFCASLIDPIHAHYGIRGLTGKEGCLWR